MTSMQTYKHEVAIRPPRKGERYFTSYKGLMAIKTAQEYMTVKWPVIVEEVK